MQICQYKISLHLLLPRYMYLYIWVCILSDTTTGGIEYVYYIGVLLHVSAFFFGHLQVGIEYTFLSSYT